jgi:uncharacterized lipoprotein YddW (UPF0748 family)
MKQRFTLIWSWAAALGAIAAIAPPSYGQTEFRAFWADRYHTGMRSSSEINSMVSRAVQGNYNAIIAQVLAYQDNGSVYHGAFWNSSILPKANGISPSFDPLGYLVQQAHANGLEAHAWIIPYRACTAWPPSGNSTLASHPEWIMNEIGAMGLGPQLIGGDAYQLDPGSPDVQEYLISIVQELVTNYAIDGVHWDYIRYTHPTAGYPADTSYTKSGLARFQARTGYVGTPPVDEPSWEDFRRLEVTELMRRAYAEIGGISTNPQQPLRHSAALITWGAAPGVFEQSSAWARFSNWKLWLQMGYLDLGIPMAYYDQTQYPTYYTGWVDKALTWRYDRHMAIGPALYKNTFANSATQIAYAQSAGADGISTYSYAVTRNDTSDFTWYSSYAPTYVFPSPASPPSMPWKDPAVSTEGTLWGQVTDGSGDPVEQATLRVVRVGVVETDGNGYYVYTKLGASPGGTSYTARAEKTGFNNVSAPVTIYPGGFTRQDFSFGSAPIVSITADVTTITQGESVHFEPTVTYQNGGSGSTYEWHFGSDTVAGSGEPGPYDRTFANTGQFDCYLIVTDTNNETGESNHITIQVDPFEAFGDFDGDGDVDLNDYGDLLSCYNGPGNSYPIPVCEVADSDGDGDVDLTDYGAFLSCYNGPGATPACQP